MSILLRNVNYIYGKGGSEEKQALRNINLEIHKNEFTAIVGHTGSGKSTLIQLFNGLEKADSGEVLFHGKNIYDKDFSMKMLRSRVGLVFQYPEHQLFEATVVKDVAFGPHNMGWEPLKADLNTFGALKDVGIGEELFDVSPLALKKLHQERKITIILVSHSMEDVAEYASRMIVMNQGEIVLDGEPRKVFCYERELKQIGLGVPQATSLMHLLAAQGAEVRKECLTVQESISAILKWLI